VVALYSAFSIGEGKGEVPQVETARVNREVASWGEEKSKKAREKEFGPEDTVPFAGRTTGGWKQKKRLDETGGHKGGEQRPPVQKTEGANPIADKKLPNSPQASSGQNVNRQGKVASSEKAGKGRQSRKKRQIQKQQSAGREVVLAGGGLEFVDERLSPQVQSGVRRKGGVGKRKQEGGQGFMVFPQATGSNKEKEARLGLLFGTLLGSESGS